MTPTAPTGTGAAGIRDARPSEVAAVTAVVVDAFAALDVCRWLVPDPATRPQILTSYFTPAVSHALTHGTVHVIDQTVPGGSTTAPGPGGLGARTTLAAAAAWLPPGAPPLPDDHTAYVAAVTGQWADRFALLDDGLARQHAPGHHHLPLLAVRPGHQNSGLGSRLLEHHHARLDQHTPHVLGRRGAAAALDAAAERSVPFYRRHGYTFAGEPLTLPGGLRTMWPMRRPPQHAPRATAPDQPAFLAPDAEAQS